MVKRTPSSLSLHSSPGCTKRPRFVTQMALVLVLTGVMRISAQPGAKCGCHTWHNVTAYHGTWKGSVAPVDEPASFLHPPPSCKVMKALEHFEVNQTYVPTFGFKYAEGDDFDVSYVLTFVRTDPHKVTEPSNATDARGRKLFSSMACVFVVAAAGPAMPDVRAEPYNGAVCMWNRVDGIGENYFLDFNSD